LGHRSSSVSVSTEQRAIARRQRIAMTLGARDRPAAGIELRMSDLRGALAQAENEMLHVERGGARNGARHDPRNLS